MPKHTCIFCLILTWQEKTLFFSPNFEATSSFRTITCFMEGRSASLNLWDLYASMLQERATVRNPPNNRRCQTSQNPISHWSTSTLPQNGNVIWWKETDRSYSKLGLRISGRLPAQHAWGPVFTPQPQSSQAYKAPQTSAKLCRFSRHLRRGGGGEPSPHTLPIEKITILRTDAITRLGSRNTGPLEFSWLGTCSTWASVS